MSASDTAGTVPVPPPAGRGGRLLAIGTWLVDRANPIFIRHVRQELRNRSFFAVFILVLVVSVLASIGFAAQARYSGGGEGLGLFAILGIALSFALWVAQAIGAYRAMSLERDDDTWDLIDLTGIRPSAILIGKIQASLLQGLFYTSATAPFMVMAYLLRGIDLILIVLLLVFLQLGGLVSTSFAVFWSCLGPNKASRALLGGLLALAMFGLWISMFSFWFGLEWFSNDLTRGFVHDPAEAWTVLGVLVNGVLAFVLLCVVFSAALLTFRADNRSTGPRLVWLGLWLNIVTWMILGVGFFEGWDDDDMALMLGVASLISVFAALLLGAFAISEDYQLSPRQGRCITAARGLRRLTSWFLGPGAARGRFCFLVMVLGAVLLLGVGRMLLDGTSNRYRVDNLNVVSTIALGTLAYGAVLLVLGDLLYRTLLGRVFNTPAARRAWLLLFAAIAVVVPALLVAILDHPAITRGVGFLSPVMGLAEYVDIADDQEQKIAFWNAMPATWYLVLGAGAVSLLVLLVQGLVHMPVRTREVHAIAGDRNPRGGD